MAVGPTRTAYVVRLRPEPGMTDEQSARALRAFLKSALRSYRLRCLSVEPEPPSESEVAR